MEKTGTWIVYNRGDEYEFAECNKCGKEQEPSGLDHLVRRKWYPRVCPQCGAKMIGTINAEDDGAYDAGKGTGACTEG